MNEPTAFSGFCPDTYLFLMELGFENNRAFFDANRARCRAVVQEPMRALASALCPLALEIDPDFNTRMTSMVSRMNRDTRFSKNKLPYRDHAWLCFKHREEAVSECFGIYFEIQPSGYGYGVGMYAPVPQVMAPFRARVLADPARFLALAASVEAAGMRLEGELYKREHFPDAPEELRPYLNRKSIGWSFFSKEVKRTLDPALQGDLEDALRLIKPLYRFVMGMAQI